MVHVVAAAATVQVRLAVVPVRVVKARAVNPVIGLPPSAPAVHVMATYPLTLLTSVSRVGAAGTVAWTAGVPLTRGAAGPGPVALVADT